MRNIDDGEKIQKNCDKGAFKYYVSKFSIILDPPPPPASALSAQTKTPHPPKFADVILE